MVVARKEPQSDEKCRGGVGGWKLTVHRYRVPDVRHHYKSVKRPIQELCIKLQPKIGVVSVGIIAIAYELHGRHQISLE